MDDIHMVQQFVKELAQVGAANPKDIVDKIAMSISNDNLDKIVMELFSMGWIHKPHKQSMSSSLPEYDQIIITTLGKEKAAEV